MGNGFTVDPAGLDGVAGQLGRAYDDFDAVRSGFSGDVCYDSAVFGDFGMADAYAGFNSAWAAELKVTSDAIAELVHKTEVTTHNYRTTEDHVKSSMTPR